MLTAYWRDHPPLHLAVAAALGSKAPVRVMIPDDRTTEVPQEGSLDQFLAMCSANGIPVRHVKRDEVPI